MGLYMWLPCNCCGGVTEILQAASLARQRKIPENVDAQISAKEYGRYGVNSDLGKTYRDGD